MEAQGCTSIAHICKELFDMHALKKILHYSHIWRKYLSLKKMADYISYGSTNKSVYDPLIGLIGASWK